MNQADIEYFRRLGLTVGVPAAVAPSFVAMVWAVVTGQWILFAVLWLIWTATAAAIYRRRVTRSG